MKKVLISLTAACLLFSGFVTVKSLARNNPIVNAPMEALSEIENSDLPYQSMGYCPDWPLLDFLCVSNDTGDWCTKPCKRY